MGSALAVAAVSRVLRQIVSGYVESYDLEGVLGTEVFVTAQPPLDIGTKTGINLFLYHTLESTTLRSQGLPAFDAQGRRLSNQPLILDLLYAVSADGRDDYHCEVLLGCAMQALHEIPVLDRTNILSVLSGDPAEDSLMSSRLFEQLERIHIRRRNVSEDTSARVWSAFQVPYRLTAYYEVSVVIIDNDEPRQTAKPVLARPRPSGSAGLVPSIALSRSVEPTSAAPGASVTLEGVNFAGTGHQLQGEGRHGGAVPDISIPIAGVGDTEITLTLPATWPAGLYDVRVVRIPEGDTSPRPSNRVPFAVAPGVTIDSIARVDGLVNVEVTLTPALEPGQTVDMTLGSQTLRGPSVTTASSSLSFEGFDVASGSTPFHVCVDGVESRWIDVDANPPTILPTAMVGVPA